MEENITTDIVLPEFVISLELIEDKNEGDVALVTAVGHNVIDALQLEGYKIRSLYTGQKGGFLVEIVTVISQIATVAWDNRAVPEEIVTDLSSLVTIFGTVLPALKQIIHAHKQQVGDKESIAHPIKILVEIDGIPLMIETSDITQANAVLQLALKYHSAHSNTGNQVTKKSKVKVQGRVPTRKRRPRR